MAATSERIKQKALALLQKQAGPVRLFEAKALGIHVDTIRALRDSGQLKQVARGLYLPADAEELSEPDLIIVTKRAPGALVCLVSALAFHELTTQIPHQVHIALKPGRKGPQLQSPPVKVYWWSGLKLTLGVERHVRSGVELTITDPARSIVDAFRYRNELGLDLALEALKTWRAQRESRPQALLDVARKLRAAEVLRPYLEALW